MKGRLLPKDREALVLLVWYLHLGHPLHGMQDVIRHSGVAQRSFAHLEITFLQKENL